VDIAVTGAGGLIGRALAVALRGRGDRVIAVGRGTAADVVWDPMAGMLDGGALDGVDAVVHLAGESLGGQRWTEEQKARIVDSRVRGTELLTRRLAALARPPAVLLSASAAGFYGDRGDEVLTEASAPPGPGNFLADVCRAWEAATAAAEAAGIRTVHLRTGMVLSPDGGALAGMVEPFRAGLGGPVGSGEQYVSWVSIDDTVGAILHALAAREVAGPLNVTGPRPVTNAELAATLGDAVGRPAVVPVRMDVLEALYGAELVRRVFVDGQRVLPARLEATGYRFRDTEIDVALDRMLN
jgi:hypothetical protein